MLHYDTVLTDEQSQHSTSPSGEDSWCFVQRAIANNQPMLSHKDNIQTPLRPDVVAKIGPIYPSVVGKTDKGKLLWRLTAKGMRKQRCSLTYTKSIWIVQRSATAKESCTTREREEQSYSAIKFRRGSRLKVSINDSKRGMVEMIQNT